MPDPLVCDTSGVLAALDRADPDHEPCARVLASWPGTLLLPPLVLAELDHLVRARLGVESARLLADDVADGAYVLTPLGSDEVSACVRLERGYGDLGLGLTDASLVIAAARAPTLSMLTLDERHLRAVRPLTGGSFRLLPADA